MSPSQFPLFRLGTLLARQLSRPVADKIKSFAVAHPLFRTWVCVGAGRVHHVLQLRLRLWTLALRQPRALPPLSEQAALNSGADILGEVAVFGLGGLIVIFEVNRQADLKDDKELEEESRRLAMLLSLAELRRELALQQQDIERLHAALQRLAKHRYRGTRPPSPSPSPPPSVTQTPPETSELLTSSTSERPQLLTTERSTPPKSERPTTPTLECSPPPVLECLPPPISEPTSE